MDYKEISDPERYHGKNDPLMSKYIYDIRYSNAQLEVIRHGLESGVDVSVYANPDIPVRVMKTLLRRLKSKDNVFAIRYHKDGVEDALIHYAKCSTKQDAMNEFAEHHSVSTILDIMDICES